MASSSDLPPDIDDFRAAPLDPPAGSEAVIEEAEIELEEGPEAPELIGEDEFWTVFRTAFDLPGIVAPDFRPLAIQPEEEPRARQASDALYRILRVYAPSLLRPQSQLIGDLMICGPFISAKVMLAREIIAARKRPPDAPAATPAGAAPAGGGQFDGWPKEGAVDGWPKEEAV